MFLGPEEYPTPYDSSVLALEFASDADEAREVLDVLDGDERERLDLINKIDFGFMIAYGFFLFVLLHKSAQIFEGRLLVFSRWLAPLIVMADLLENIQLFKIVAIHPDYSVAAGSVFYQLEMYTWTKWLFIALALFTLGWVLLSVRKVRWIGYILLLPVMVGVYAFLSKKPFVENLLGQLIFLGFLISLLFCFFYKRELAADRR